jgi:hypothetical protein
VDNRSGSSGTRKNSPSDQAEVGRFLGHLPRSFQLQHSTRSEDLVVCNRGNLDTPSHAWSNRRLHFVWQLYHCSHSLVTFALVFGIVWLVARRPVLEMLGWLLHILIDIATHQGMFAIHFLWPFSAYSVSTLRWENRTFFVVNYSALAAVYSWLWIRSRRTRLQKQPAIQREVTPRLQRLNPSELWDRKR